MSKALNEISAILENVEPPEKPAPTAQGAAECPYCNDPLAVAPNGGANANQPCSRCERLVKPRYLTTADSAARFRHDLRLVVRVAECPHEVASRLMDGLDRKVWTELKDVKGNRFKEFSHFCRDPNGLAADPAMVESVVKRLRGENAFRLLSVAESRQGERADLGTSRHVGEKSRTKRSDTRARAVANAPSAVATACKVGLIGIVEAERIAVAAKKNPEAKMLAVLLEELESLSQAPVGGETKALARRAVKDFRRNAPPPRRKNSKAKRAFITLGLDGPVAARIGSADSDDAMQAADACISYLTTLLEEMSNVENTTEKDCPSRRLRREIKQRLGFG